MSVRPGELQGLNSTVRAIGVKPKGRCARS